MDTSGSDAIQAHLLSPPAHEVEYYSPRKHPHDANHLNDDLAGTTTTTTAPTSTSTTSTNTDHNHTNSNHKHHDDDRHGSVDCAVRATTPRASKSRSSSNASPSASASASPVPLLSLPGTASNKSPQQYTTSANATATASTTNMTHLLAGDSDVTESHTATDYNPMSDDDGLSGTPNVAGGRGSGRISSSSSKQRLHFDSEHNSTSEREQDAYHTQPSEDENPNARVSARANGKHSARQVYRRVYRTYFERPRLTPEDASVLCHEDARALLLLIEQELVILQHRLEKEDDSLRPKTPKTRQRFRKEDDRTSHRCVRPRPRSLCRRCWSSNDIVLRTHRLTHSLLSALCSRPCSDPDR